jgi:hypothetical protein
MIELADVPSPPYYPTRHVVSIAGVNSKDAGAVYEIGIFTQMRNIKSTRQNGEIQSHLQEAFRKIRKL